MKGITCVQFLLLGVSLVIVSHVNSEEVKQECIAPAVIAEIELKLQEVLNEKSTLTKVLEDTRTRLSSLESEVQTAKAEAQTFHDQARSLEGVKISLETQVSELQGSKASLQTQLHELQEKFAKSATELENSKSTIHALEESSKASLDQNVADAKSSGYQEAVQKFTAEIQALNKKHLDELTKYKTETNAEIGQIKARSAEEISKKIAEGKEELNQLQAKFEKSKAEISSLRRDFEEKLKSAKSGFHFDLWSREKISQAAVLLSDAFDWSAVHCTNLYTRGHQHYSVVSERAAEIYKNSLAPTLSIYAEKVQTPVKAAYDTHVRPTVDPLLTKVAATTRPHINKHLPVISAKLELALHHAYKGFAIARQHAKQYRENTIVYVKQFPEISSNAQKLVDFGIGLVAAPVLYVLLRAALRLVFNVLWYALTTAVCILTLGLCCRRRKGAQHPAAKKADKALKKAAGEKTTAPTGAASKSSIPKRKSKKN